MRVVVVGSGISGVMAALRAKERDCDVVLVGSGRGASSRSLGVVDVLGYINGKELESPEEGLRIVSEVSRDHPYSILGAERVKKALKFFKEVSEKAGVPFRGWINRNIHIATQFGTVKPTCLVPERVYAARVELWSGKVVSITGASERDFNPRFIAASLSWLIPKLGVAQPIRIEASSGGDIVIAPLKHNTGGPAIPLLGDGEYILKRLLQYCLEEGIKVVEDRIKGAKIDGGELKAFVGDRQSYTADAFVLTTGDWIGGGLVRMEEQLIGLELICADTSAKKTPFPEKGHSYSKAGVRVDENLTPFYKGEKILNLRAAGALLGGYDYCVEKSGWGVAITTGYVAGGVE